MAGQRVTPLAETLIPHQRDAVNSAAAVWDLYEQVVDLRDVRPVVGDDLLERAFRVTS